MITCRIYTPEGTFVELETEIAIFDAPDARRGITHGQRPIVVTVEKGHLTTVLNGVRTSYELGEGVVYVKDNVATFLVESFK
ncbi:MAG: hypothetical protein Q4G41_04070 [Coriobacteriales bacterium]|jgi:F0F1-type ATP synthase epsilon subunit|nr:hypothetical protein [Coriobacteriales bacterium]MDO5709272.1 hypothetical protein [Coriobacteriales bacterium]